MSTTAPLRVETSLPITGDHELPSRSSRTYFYGEAPRVTDVQWRANRSDRGVIVSVTAFARHENYSWYRTSPALAVGLNTTPPPAWVPAAPEWFEAVVAQMLEAVPSA
ncbi:hypothetical protein [Terrabacter terrigena]|uniref:DUF317 domain-containing protein n=1 Tax=Terrabacter terrigena TaxID=574718 RepID=A0ABW3MZZ0_9MICO